MSRPAMYGTLTYAELPDGWGGPAIGMWRLAASPDAMMRIKRIFPRAEKSRRADITLSHTPAVCRDLLWILGRWSLGMTDEDYERLTVAAREHKEREDLVHELLAGDLDMKARHATGVAKAPYVAEFCRMLLEAEQKIVLFGWHRDVYDIWLERLREFNPVLYTGSESGPQKEAAKQRFLEPVREGLEHEACRILMISLRSGAGLDGLQDAAHVAVFGELDWSPAMHDQCIGRLHRDGQGESVVAYFLVSDVGSDPVMADVLNVKRQQGEPLRDPDAALFEAAGDTADRVKLLAKEVLSKRKTKAKVAA